MKAGILKITWVQKHNLIKSDCLHTQRIKLLNKGRDKTETLSNKQNNAIKKSGKLAHLCKNTHIINQAGMYLN